MILYKYLPPARIDIIQKRLIRFTQYGDFNDPFELNLNIKKLAEEDEIRSIVGKDFVKQVQEKNIVKLLLGMLQKKTNSLLGALSLSEVSDHELMWSHYAEEHKGYVIGFDSLHPFFNQKISDTDELRHLRKIEYHETPPVINLMNTNGTELFFVKSSKWTYEAEWRMLLPLSDATEIINEEPYAIHLFKYPTKAIKRIILGARSSNETKSIIHSLLSDKECLHIALYKAQLDSSSYGISINKEERN